jgi:amino acid efflux transporter
MIAPSKEVLVAADGCGRDAPGRLTAWHGTALYVGAVLGSAVIALPALAAEAAGPASLLAWLGLVVLSIALATTFAALGARYPDAGGVSTYVRRAFGARAAAAAGWCFYLAPVPAGAPAAGMFAGGYVAAAAGGGRASVLATAAGLMATTTVANLLGIHVSARLQLALAGLLAALLAVAAATSLPHARLSNLHPFAPHGWAAVGAAAGLLVWGSAGWEAITHLAAEFRRPGRDLPRATAAALVVVGVLYLAIATATILVLGAAAGRSAAPVADLLARGAGGPARVIAAVMAVLLTLGVMNAYLAGAAKLGAALARDGAMPGWLAGGSRAGQVPRRSLLFVAALSGAALLAVAVSGASTHPLVLLVNGALVVVYALGTAAAIRLLPRRSAVRRAAVTAFVASLALAISIGWYLAWPAALAGGALLYLRHRARLPTQARSADHQRRMPL